jgi:uncharacterized membrane protein
LPPDVLSPQPEERQVLAEWFSGPFPPPDMLARYNEMVPNGDFAERLLRPRENEQQLVRDQSAHRQRQEHLALQAKIWQSKVGTFVAAFLFLCLLGVVVFAIQARQQAIAIAALTLDVGYVLGIFVLSDSIQSRERIEKARILAGQESDEVESH